MNAPDHSRWSEELAAYMLGALDSAEVAALERHLAGCERCREEMRWLEPAVHSLTEDVARQEPPPGLRERLMAEVRADASPAPDLRPAPEADRAPSRAKRWSLRPAMGLAVAALLIAAAVGYEVGRDGSDGSGDTTVLSQQGSGIEAKMVREGDGGTLQLAGVDQLPPGKVLEAWVSREGEVEAVAALFVPDRHGRAETRIADIGGVDEVMVTEEPQGGSEAPTSKPIVAMTVPQ